MQKFSPIIQIICVSNLSKPRHSGPHKYLIRASYRTILPLNITFSIFRDFLQPDRLFGTGLDICCRKSEWLPSMQNSPDFRGSHSSVGMSDFNFEHTIRKDFFRTFRFWKKRVTILHVLCCNLLSSAP